MLKFQFSIISSVKSDYSTATVSFRVARFLLKTLLRLLFKIKVEGLENLPSEGGYILAGNHLSGWLDPFLLLAFAPATPRIYFIAAKEEVLQPAWRRFFTERIGGVIPVERGKFTAIKEVSEKVGQVLEGGGVLGIFPEGDVSETETGQLLPLKKGIGYFAAHSNAAIVPVVFQGTKEPYLRKQIKMIVGHPLPAYAGGKEVAEQQVQATAQALAAILPPPVSDPPHQPKLLQKFFTNLFVQEANERHRTPSNKNRLD